jgi:hypothetical protein
LGGGDVGVADQWRQQGAVVAEDDLRVAEEGGLFGEESAAAPLI